MKRRREVNQPPEAGAASRADAGKEPRRKRRRWRRAAVVLLVLVLLGAIGRAVLPTAVRDYVNRTLDRSPLYAGEIGEIDIHLWRGAYSIHDVRISKTTGNVPVPFFEARQVDFSIEWNALLHGRLVGSIFMDQPELNFVDAPAEGEEQTGAGGAWLQIIQDLFPFTINSAIVKDGSIHFRAYQIEEPVDIYLSEVQGTIDNLGNIRDETTPLFSTVQATATVMDQADLEYKMTLDPFSYRPTFHLAVRLLGLDVTKINDFARAYGNFDFKEGWFDFVLEADAKEGLLTGYAKPLFRDLEVFSLTEDIDDGNVLQFFWQAIVGAATKLLENPRRDQFGTLIPFTGDLSGATTTDIPATIGNILRNAFVRAYLPRLEDTGESTEPLEFGPPEFEEMIAIGGSP